MVDAPVLLVGDIDRGGVFAQLYGTIALLDEEEKKRIKGVVINKFRGDRSILAPGLAQLEKLCGVPVAGVVPSSAFDNDDIKRSGKAVICCLNRRKKFWFSKRDSDS